MVRVHDGVFPFSRPDLQQGQTLPLGFAKASNAPAVLEGAAARPADGEQTKAQPAKRRPRPARVRLQRLVAQTWASLRNPGFLWLRPTLAGSLTQSQPSRDSAIKAGVNG